MTVKGITGIHGMGSEWCIIYVLREGVVREKDEVQRHSEVWKGK